MPDAIPYHCERCGQPGGITREQARYEAAILCPRCGYYRRPDARKAPGYTREYAVSLEQLARRAKGAHLCSL